MVSPAWAYTDATQIYVHKVVKLRKYGSFWIYCLTELDIFFTANPVVEQNNFQATFLYWLKNRQGTLSGHLWFKYPRCGVKHRCKIKTLTGMGSQDLNTFTLLREIAHVCMNTENSSKKVILVCWISLYGFALSHIVYMLKTGKQHHYV